jgi:hypothetical protein
MEEWEEGDPDWIWQVANTWKMVSVTLSSYNIDNKHGLHLKEYESIVSSENWQL